MPRLRLDDVYRAEARANARILDAFRAGSGACFLVFQAILSRGPETDLDREQAEIILPMLAAYFILAFLSLLVASTRAWVKYVAVTADVLFVAGLFHLLYRAQFPQPVQYPFASASILCLIITTAHLRYSVLCAAYTGVLALSAYLFLALYWHMPNEPVAQASLTLGILGAVVVGTVARARRMALRAAEREVARALYEQKLPRRTAAALLDEQKRDVMAIGSAEVSVLCVEVHEFAALAETRTPREVAELVERFARAAHEAVFRHGGTVERFQGDRVTALFGAPMPQKDHAHAAVAAALAMREAIDRLNSQRQTGEFVLHAGFAVHTGEAIVGVMGRPDHPEYTAIGETMHVAARLRQMTSREGGDILVSERAFRLIEPDFDCTPTSPLTITGKRLPMRVWRVRKPIAQADEAPASSAAS